MRRYLLLLLVLIALGAPGGAQDHPEAESRVLTNVREGPQVSHLVVTRLPAGREVTITGRNAAGTWVRVTYDQVSGWVMTGKIRFDEGFSLGEVAILDAPAANPATEVSRSQAALMDGIPLLPELSDAAQDILREGIQRQRDPDAAVKIGDSLSASDFYLDHIDPANAELGPHADLAPLVARFAPSFDGPHPAARLGMSSYGVFDPFWADNEVCEPNEAPWACAVRLHNPAYALILFGPNDVRSMDTDAFTLQMLRLGDAFSQAGVLPIFFTFSTDPDDEFFWQGIAFNQVLVDVSAATGWPLVHLWLAGRDLPAYGLDQDDVHLRASGDRHLDFSDGDEAYFGMVLHNLLALRALERVSAWRDDLTSGG